MLPSPIFSFTHPYLKFLVLRNNIYTFRFKDFQKKSNIYFYWENSLPVPPCGNVVTGTVSAGVAPRLNASRTGFVPTPIGNIMVSPDTAGQPFIPPGAW
jgi:hypothetical protein